MMMVVPKLGKNTKRCQRIKKPLRIQRLYYGTLGWTSLYSFTDGNVISAIDRNGLRPSRYTLTKSGFVIMSSEIGVLISNQKM
jgi:glutamate synthase (ferredoxin)